jgi:hypothetical protein
VASRDRRTRKTTRSGGTSGAAPILAVLLAIVAVAAVIAAVQLLGPSPAPGASPSATAAVASAGVAGAPSGAGHTSAPSKASPSAAPNVAGATFTTSGVDANWQGFTWSNLPADSPLLTADSGSIHIFNWAHGFVARGTRGLGANSVVWTSADGQTWAEATALAGPQERVLVAVSPSGLVAIDANARDNPDAYKVWTSADGTTWSRVASPTGLSDLDSIAGTSSGLVAVVHTTSGSGKTETTQYGLEQSTDGLMWTPVAGAPALSSQVIFPSVSSNAGRFFLLGAPTALSGKGGGVVWWSDDGRAWTSVEMPLYPKSVDFASSGMIVQTSSMSTGGGAFGLEVSTDGGKTWQVDDKFGPLGATVCGAGECAVGPDGEISSNGATFLAVKPDGHAWTSPDGKTWSSIAWNGPAAGTRSFLVLPRGIVVGNSYGAAK